MIGEYIAGKGMNNLVSELELEPFEIKVQTLERTFVDKVFALCDYYMLGEVTRQSRHIYDIFKVIQEINCLSLRELINDVRADRSVNKRCLSAQPNVSISDILYKIITEAYFRKDYEEITSGLLNENVSYDEAIESIRKIADGKYFDI